VESNMRRCAGKATSRAKWCLEAWTETIHGHNEA
jgi:hypothetical protein